MATHGGTHIELDGLVFGYDTGNPGSRYYPGAPTTNIIYAGNPTLNNGVYWTNSGTGIYNNNETDIDKPEIPQVDTSSLLMMSGYSQVGGSQHVGCASFSGAASTTYTISVYFRQNRAGSNQPYFRTNVNNNSLGNFNYKGNTNAATWPVNKWIRISATATLQSNETGGYLSNYIGTAGDKIWYFAPQVEQKSFASPLVLGTRSSTEGLLDLTKNTVLDLTTVSFDLQGYPLFDRTDDYLNTGKTASDLGMYDSAFTAEAVFKITYDISGDNMVFGTNQTALRQGLHIGARNGILYHGHYSADFPIGSVGLNETVHVCWVYDGATAHTYKNGVLLGSKAIGSFIGTTNIWIGRHWGYFGGEIPVAKIYNRALSQEEITRNFTAYKKRFSI